jgi:hypothetical protein
VVGTTSSTVHTSVPRQASNPNHYDFLIGLGADMEPLSDENVYRKPPQEILDIIDSPPEPSITLSPCREKVRRHASYMHHAATTRWPCDSSDVTPRVCA